MNKNTDLQFMRNPDKWPNWPLLPLKKKGDFHCQYAFITEQVGPPFYLYEGSIYEPKVTSSLQSLPKKAYLTLQAILDDGWEVD